MTDVRLAVHARFLPSRKAIPMIGATLHALGRRGPVIIVVAMLIGLVLPGTALKPLLPVAAFLLITGSFLAASFSPAEAQLGNRCRLLIAFGWICVVLPALLFWMLQLVHTDPLLGSGMMLAAVAPPIGSAAAIATMLDLRPRLALTLSISLTVAAPLTMPVYLSLAGGTVSANFPELAATLLLIIGCALAVAWLARRYRSRLLGVLPDAYAASAISVIGLFIVGVTAAASLRAYFIADPAACLETIGAAFLLNLGGSALGSLVFSSWGLRDALTIGLVTGNRNVTLAWAIAYGSIPTAAETFVTAAVVPVLLLPLLLTFGMKVGAARAPRRNVFSRQQ